jgi:hypothetical protein
MLPSDDQAFLEERNHSFEVTADGGMVCVVIKEFKLPAGYEPATTDLLLRLPPGYPDAPPDMFWCDPPVSFAGNGGVPKASEVRENYLGRTWQRFSRHLTGGVWRTGDNLQTYLKIITKDLERSGRGTP